MFGGIFFRQIEFKMGYSNSSCEQYAKSVSNQTDHATLIYESTHEDDTLVRDR